MTKTKQHSVDYCGDSIGTVLKQPWATSGTPHHHHQPQRLPKSTGESVSVGVRVHFYQLHHVNIRVKNQVEGVDIRHDPRLQRHIALGAEMHLRLGYSMTETGTKTRCQPLDVP